MIRILPVLRSFSVIGFLLISLISTQNIFCNITLRRVNEAEVSIYQEKLKEEIKNHNIFKYTAAGVGVLIAAYVAYKKLNAEAPKLDSIKPLDPMVYIYPNLVANSSTIDELCRIKRENGFVLANQSFWTSLKANWKTTIGLPIVGMGVNNLLPYIQSKFKEYNINLIVKDKTNIQLFWKALKNTAAALDNMSGMLDVYNNDAEVIGLRTIAAASKNMTEIDVNSKLKHTLNFMNGLTSDLEKVLAYMQYKLACYASENMIEEHNQANKLIEELKVLIDEKLVKLDLVLTKIENDKIITEENGLLNTISDYQELFEFIIERFADLT
ncbi:MAG: hypothetical protein P4L22_00675 [Candidatus Babeliales bacterium]|nr:hypothetical protein [Candidatus Babeliales bacterium]